MVTVPVILAGGIGERFWPASRSTYPKQLLKLTGSMSMLEKTIRRIEPLCKESVKPLIITGKKIAPTIKKVLPGDISIDCIIEEQGKNTAPAIALAAAWIEKKYGEAVMVILSADHEINPEKMFISAVRAAITMAVQHHSMVIFGIPPTRPDTGYGYVNIGDMVPSKNAKVYSVKKFVEKPTHRKAESYCKSGSYLWNSGMFVWKTSTIIAAFKNQLPSLYDLVEVVEKKRFTQASIDSFYAKAESVSIDYGIMEHAKNVYAVAGDFIWDDIGSWEAMARIYPDSGNNNTVAGKMCTALDCSKTLVFNQTDTAVATVGLDDCAVIVADGAVLVIKRDKLPAIKKYLSKIKTEKLLPETLF